MGCVRPSQRRRWRYKAAQYQKQIDCSLRAGCVDAVVDYNARQECTRLRRQKKIDDANTKGLGDNPIQILGGEDFPQGRTVTISINDGLFTGTFSGRDFHVSSRSSAALTAQAEGAYNAKLKDTEFAVMAEHRPSNYRYLGGSHPLWKCDFPTVLWTHVSMRAMSWSTRISPDEADARS